MNIALMENAGKQKYNAGSKARKDALAIAISCGYEYIPLFHNGTSKLKIAIEIVVGCVRMLLMAGKGDNVLIQYPYNPVMLNKLLFSFLRLGRHMKGYQVIVLIHDINSLRENDSCDVSYVVETLEKELSNMRSFHLIYHNRKMEEVCESAYPSLSHSVLGAFDYLCTENVIARSYDVSPTVVIAGNLSGDKCGYVYHLSDLGGIHFALYGTNYTGDTSPNIEYRGAYEPDALASHIEGQFGLVWDGDTVETCNGANGVYLRYNNPHKFSLYLAAGIPVIVWEKSAMAEYVKEYGIGICVGSLWELNEIFKKMSEEDYLEMVAKVNIVRHEVVCGKHLKTVLMQLEEDKRFISREENLNN